MGEEDSRVIVVEQGKAYRIKETYESLDPAPAEPMIWLVTDY